VTYAGHRHAVDEILFSSALFAGGSGFQLHQTGTSITSMIKINGTVNRPLLFGRKGKTSCVFICDFRILQTQMDSQPFVSRAAP